MVKIRIDSDSVDSIDLLPVIKTVKDYSWEKFRGDFKASINVAVLDFPQGIAYALIAGIPFYYGIFAAVIASLVALFFGKSPFIKIGPTNATAVMLLSCFIAADISTPEARLASLSVIVLLIGIFLILSAVFNFTNLLGFVSRTVITGYVTAAALLILANQTTNAFGFHLSQDQQSYSFFGNIYYAYVNLGDSQVQSIVIFFITLVIVWVAKSKLKKFPAEILGIALASLIAFTCTKFFDIQFDCLGALVTSEWTLTLPNFYSIDLRTAAGSALAIAILCGLEGASIGKTMASRNAQRLNVNQEIFTLGMANVGCALFSGMPVSGSLTRSALNVTSGAKTAMANLFMVIWLLLGILFLGNALQYVPKAALAGVIFYLGISLINKNNIRIALNSTKSDAFVFIITCASALLFPLSDAIFIGVALSIMLFLRKASAPEVVEYSFKDDGNLSPIDSPSDRQDPKVSIVHVEGNLFFGASDFFQTQTRLIAADKNLKVLILKLRNAHNIDATSLIDIKDLAKSMQVNQGHLILCEVKDNVMRLLKKSKVLTAIGEENVFLDDTYNPTLSAAAALRRAKTLLGGATPDISIYAKPTQN